MKNPNFETAQMQAAHRAMCERERSPEVLRMTEELNAESRRLFWRLFVPGGAVFAVVWANAAYWTWSAAGMAHALEFALGGVAFIALTVASRYPRR